MCQRRSTPYIEDGHPFAPNPQPCGTGQGLRVNVACELRELRNHKVLGGWAPT